MRVGPWGPTGHNFITEFSDETLNPLKSDIVSKRIFETYVFGFDTLKMKFRRLTLWKPNVAVAMEGEWRCPGPGPCPCPCPRPSRCSSLSYFSSKAFMRMSYLASVSLMSVLTALTLPFVISMSVLIVLTSALTVWTSCCPCCCSKAFAVLLPMLRGRGKGKRLALQGVQLLGDGIQGRLEVGCSRWRRRWGREGRRWRRDGGCGASRLFNSPPVCTLRALVPGIHRPGVFSQGTVVGMQCWGSACEGRRSEHGGRRALQEVKPPG